MEAQAKIEKLKRELENAQKNLFSIRKNEYAETTGSPLAPSGSSNKAAAAPRPGAPKAGAKPGAEVPAKKAPAKKPPADAALVKKAAALKPVARPPPSEQ